MTSAASRQQTDAPLVEGSDAELERIVREEEQCLARVLSRLALRTSRRPEPVYNEYSDYDAQLLALRDELACARLEDVPPLVEQMERLQSLAARRREVVESHVDAKSPYFGHLVLEEGGRQRDVLVGRGTFLDTASGVRVVDWRDAPVSRLYYRYEEGDDYDEIFGDREIEGRVVVRRTVAVVDGKLRRVACPQGRFACGADGRWTRLASESMRLAGGQGTAARAEQHHRLAKLGVGDGDLTEDKHLREITALIDPRQFELITREDSGLVVIQGGAGSGKTTIGLHRLAYLAYLDPRRFRPDRVLVVVYNDALARYVSKVLPALEVEGVPIRTYENWARRLRTTHLPDLPSGVAEETPAVVTRLKKHPAMLHAVDAHARRIADRFETELQRALGLAPDSAHREALQATWARTSAQPFAHRVHAIASGMRSHAATLPVDARVALERLARIGLEQARDIPGSWAEMLSDRRALEAVFERFAPGEFSSVDFDRALAWCSNRCSQLLGELDEQTDPSAAGDGYRATRAAEAANARQLYADDEPDILQGIDGQDLEEPASLDREDDSILLRLIQRLRGPLMRGTRGKEALVYEHVFVDEAQDLSPVELAVVLDTLSRARSITLAGDVAQRLHMDNGFSDWRTVLDELGLAHTEVEPLRLSYRSTHQIIAFSTAVLGPLAEDREGHAVRSGAPVELFDFGHTGDAVAFLAEQLRELMQAEPRASVAVIARYPEQADLYYAGLKNGDVPRLRRVAEQDFSFAPGVDVTDVRQVKGLEFDYVILVEATSSSYPVDEESRHLLHIAATRAAHQLWLLSPGTPSRLVPEKLRVRSY
ncbi:MAG: ATP-binding domain-containing protein [Polyangiaceae bacterium]|nr:ATP-binding domain-containing protein [Polyangiaceae bacterium]